MPADLDPVIAGFLPLMDSVLLVLAAEKGFAREEGIDLVLVRETSWANIRDRVAVGHFDVAHMLAPMPLAAALGLSPFSVPLLAPMALGLGGNAVTVSTALWGELEAAGAPADADAVGVGAALSRVVRASRRRLRFGVVHPFSGHNYELRYWLAACGIDPDRDVEIGVLPPALQPEALRAGTIDGYCVGEPWNSLAVERGSGRIATLKSAIWRSSPEKVLGLTESWAMANPALLARLLRAIHRAAAWLRGPEAILEAATLMAEPRYLDLPAALLARGLSGHLVLDPRSRLDTADFFLPEQRAATFPWISHALWFYSQMVRWGHVEHSPDNARRAAATFRPDLYRAALAPLVTNLPTANAKVEGALASATLVTGTRGPLSLGPDGFFDGRIFDPDQIEAYIASQSDGRSATA
ncbi:MAG: ABC transporter substrate-binding protein [Devosia sp.]|nr:ABC transporter substrate-binding protein [Devosia sp.]